MVVTGAASTSASGSDGDLPAVGYALVCVGSDSVRELVLEALREEGIEARTVDDEAGMQDCYRLRRPGVLVAEHAPPDLYADDIDQARRRLDAESGIATPLLLIAQPDASGHIDPAPPSELLTLPLSPEYAGARILEWVDRTPVRWRRAELPANEAQRLAALEALGVLDTEPEERFDRVVRIAAEAFDVPIALVSLVDSDRQWFKARQGLEAPQTHRDMAFCAHVVRDEAAMIVPDTELDDRFADHPLVRGEPGIRFYAGVPLVLDDGHCVGTLCLIDTRPRDADFGDRALLDDLRDMVVAELQKAP